MSKLSRFRQRKKRSALPTILAIIILIAAIVLAQWLVKKDKENRQKPEPAPDSLVVEEKLADAAEAPTPATETPAPPAKLNATKTARQNYPADPQPQTRKARMLSDGLYILIIKNEHALELYNNGKKVKTYPVGLGKYPEDKAAVGDMRTPEGHFYINFIRDSSTWTHDFKDGKGETPGAYGPWFMALYTGKANTFSGKTWTGIGIHGTHDPATIGKNDSEGCIRMHNKDVQELKQIIGDNQYVAVDILGKRS